MCFVCMYTTVHTRTGVEFPSQRRGQLKKKTNSIERRSAHDFHDFYSRSIPTAQRLGGGLFLCTTSVHKPTNHPYNYLAPVVISTRKKSAWYRRRPRAKSIIKSADSNADCIVHGVNGSTSSAQRSHRMNGCLSATSGKTLTHC